MSLPTTIGHSVRLLNEITSRDGSGCPAFFVAGGRRTASAPILLARAQEEERGRKGFEFAAELRRAPGGSARFPLSPRHPPMTEFLVGGASAAPLSMRATAIVASAVIRAARQLLTDLERGRRIDAAVLRSAMEAAFGASDATGAWNWKTAYDACEAATVLFLRRYGVAMRTKATSPTAMLPMLMRIMESSSTQTRRSEESESPPAVLDTDRVGVRRQRCRHNHARRRRAGAVGWHRPSCHPCRIGGRLANSQRVRRQPCPRSHPALSCRLHDLI